MLSLSTIFNAFILADNIYIDHKDHIDLLFCLIFLESSSPINLHSLTWPFSWTIPAVTNSFSFISGPMDGLEFVTLKCRRRIDS